MNTVDFLEMQNEAKAIIGNFIKDKTSKVRWGMSQKEVKQLKTGKSLPCNPQPGYGALAYQYKQGNVPYRLSYGFKGGKLYFVDCQIIMWRIITRGMKMDMAILSHTGIFNSITGFLIPEYGMPVYSGNGPGKNPYENGDALVWGVGWDLPDTHIDLTLYLPTENQQLKGGLMSLSFADRNVSLHDNKVP